MAYHLEGRLLEVCDCRVLCPCWIGEDPDNGTCDTIVAYHFDKGTIEGVDVTGTTIAIVAHLPGNILLGNWRVAVYIDDKASAAQEAAKEGEHGASVEWILMGFSVAIAIIGIVMRSAVEKFCTAMVCCFSWFVRKLIRQVAKSCALPGW